VTIDKRKKQPQPVPPPQHRDGNHQLQLVRAGTGIVSQVSRGQNEKAFANAVLAGIKLADDREAMKNPLASPLAISRELKTLGINALAWKPETLMAEIDRKYYGWTTQQVADALDHFHETGELQTNISPILRQKIYAIRLVATGDAAHNEWHVFEKVGCAFNDRTVHFGLVERLSSGEAARTLAFIEALRPDSYSSEVRAYIAACCHEDGLYTTKPSKYLALADEALEAMNCESSGMRRNNGLCQRIIAKVATLKANVTGSTDLVDNIETAQAAKIVAADIMAEEAAHS
jgi:hypothetical protein